MIRKFSALAIILLLAVGCASKEYKWYGNTRALDATTMTPVGGNPEARTYIHPDYKNKVLGKVHIAPVTAKGTMEETYPKDFLDRVKSGAKGGVFEAISLTDRFAGVVADEREAEYTIEIDARTHVAVLGDGRVVADPVVGDMRSRVTLVYTVKKIDTAEVIIKYSTIANSDWGYTKRVFDDLARKSAKAGEEILFILAEM